MKKYAIGTDIGGSHIKCAVFDLEKKEILKESIIDNGLPLVDRDDVPKMGCVWH